jgi:hypothetical protein
MKAYKVTLLIIDHDKLGKEAIVNEIENVRYPNRCLSPSVMSIQSREIGEWSDNHPLNFQSRYKAEFNKLFSNKDVDD